MAHVWFNGIQSLGIGPNTFHSWISNPAFGLDPTQQGIADGPDGDGIPNGVENFFGTAPNGFSRGLLAEGMTMHGQSAHFTFRHPQGTLADNLSASYEWSENLSIFHPEGMVDGTAVAFSTTTEEDITTITAKVTGTIPETLFVRVAVTED